VRPYIARMMYNVGYRYHDLSHIETARIESLRFWNRGHQELTEAELESIEYQRRMMGK